MSSFGLNSIKIHKIAGISPNLYQMRLQGCCLRVPNLSLIFQEEGCETASVSSQPDRSAFKKIEKKLKKIEKKN